MNLLMLSGNSLHNRDWIETVSTKLPPTIGTRVIQYYRHWETGDEWIYLAHEKLALQRQQLERIKPYGVFAKSIGTVLTMQGIDEGIVKPQFLMLLGIPLNYVQKEYPEFKEKLASVAVPVTIVHNTHDKVGSSDALKAYLGNLEHIRFIEPDMTGHDYEDYDVLINELQLLTESNG